MDTLIKAWRNGLAFAGLLLITLGLAACGGGGGGDSGAAVQTWTVTANAGSGGTITPASQSVNQGSTATFTVTPDTGYSITEVTGGCGGTLEGATYTTGAISADCTVTASFTLNSYTLTYSTDANGVLTGTSTQTVDHGADGSAVTAAPATGYHFVDWSDSATANPRTDSNVTGDISVTANFAINSYTVTATADSSGAISPASRTVNHGAITTFTVTPDTGYSITEVTGSCGGTLEGATYTTGAISADCTVTASFTLNSYTLTYSTDANGVLTGTSTQTVDHGADGSAVTAVPATGYHFVDWSDSATANPRTDTGVTGDISVTANFAINSYTLAYSAGVNGAIGGTTPQTVNHGASGTAVTAIPATGYHFVDWSDSATANPRTDSSVTGDISVTANFAINTYTVSASAGAGGAISPMSQVVDHGATTTFTITPENGNAVSGTSGCNGTLSNNIFTTEAITADCTLSVTFAPGFAIGGTLTGLGTGKSVTLLLNGANELTLDATANGNPYSFDVLLPDLTDYTVTLKGQPPLHECTVSNATGTLAGSSVTNIDVACVGMPAVAMGNNHTVAIQPDGTLWAWGRNAQGQLGLGDTTGRSSPTQVGSASDWVAVSAGYIHTLALKADGTLWGWGSNYNGELGVGDTTDRSSPEQVGSASDWVAVISGSNHALARKADGTLWGWGSNASGQLGLGDTTDRSSPEQVGSASDWAAVSAGSGHTLARKTDGTLWGWGSNTSGQLGLGDTTDRSSPEQVGSASDWAAVSAGSGHTLARKTDGTLWAWGLNNTGQLGLNDSAQRSSPTQVGGDSDWAAVGAGSYHTLAIKDDGTLWGWGSNSIGQLGLGDAINSRASPTRVGSASDWAGAVAGGGSSVAIKTDGTLSAWGDNNLGQLGLGVFGFFTSPTQNVTGTVWAAASTGIYHTLAIKADSTLWAWGSNTAGQLGLGDGTSRISPEQVGSASDWVAVSTGLYHTLAIKADGTLWAWGYNGSGQLGLGDTANRSSPEQVGSASDWVAVSAGSSHALARKADGTLWGWGSNTSGQLGLGDTTDRSSPEQVGSASDWAAVSAGGSHTLARKVDGTLWAWGYNGSGQLGLNDSVQRNSPTQVGGDGGDTDWVAVSAGGSHTLARKTDGTLWGWGSNASGQLGLNDSVQRNSPTQVGGDSDWVAVNAGGSHTHARKSDGTLWGWGYNQDGQLGLGDTAQRRIPIQVGGDSDWIAIATGSNANHTFAIKSDNTLWAWGANAHHQLGVRTGWFSEPQAVPGW